MELIDEVMDTMKIIYIDNIQETFLRQFIRPN